MTLINKVAVNSSGALIASDQLFKTPNNPAPKRKKILDEDAYTQDVEDIIERDFYPDLPKLKAQLEYREALERNDIVKLRELKQKYESRPGTGLSGYKSPATFETPVISGESTPSVHHDGDSDGASHRGNLENVNKRVHSQSLDNYLAKNTSEDNASFEAMMEEAEERHRTKFAWLYDKEGEHDRFQQDALALPSAEDQATDRHRVPCLDTWTYTNKNYLMYVPDGAPLTEAEKQDLILKQRGIVHVNTRFHKMPFNELANRQAISAAAQVQAKAKEGKIGVDGKEVVPTDEPKVNGYGFVCTPSPAPGVGESPLMTWGEIEGTPFRLDGNNTPGPSFRIAAMPARDKLALELAENVGKHHREKKQLALKAVKATLASPSPRISHVERLASMSPAAQRLASSKLGIHIGTDKSLRLSYTPSPAHRKNADGATPRGDLSATNTPSKTPDANPLAAKGPAAASKRTSGASGGNAGLESLTDDLLKLPKRAKATDFFRDT